MTEQTMTKVNSQDNWIREIVVDKTFADIGGLWGTKNEKVSVAIKAGAKEATMIDINFLKHKLWVDFNNHCKALNISDYRCLQADVNDQNLKQIIGRYDVVHCSGIIYHVPDPFLMLRNLHSVVKEYLILTSMTVPSIIKTEVGSLILEGGIAYFVPLLNETQRRIFATHFERENITIAGINAEPVNNWISSNGIPKYGPWWWLWTPEFLKKILEVCRFEVLEVHETWKGKSHSFLCRSLG